MSDGVRLRELPDVDWKSDRSGMVSRGGTKVVEAEPVPVEMVEDWMLLVIDPMVLMEPVGDPEVDLSGIVTE
jgi:hypothetical protein